MKYQVMQRLEFISVLLRNTGRLNRKDLMDKFGISKPQAAIDIARFKELNPRAIKYNNSAKTYLYTGKLSPIKHPTITITVKGGMVQDVAGLPEGWLYEIDDQD